MLSHRIVYLTQVFSWIIRDYIFVALIFNITGLSAISSDAGTTADTAFVYCKISNKIPTIKTGPPIVRKGKP